MRVGAVLGDAAIREGAEEQLVENVALVDSWVVVAFVEAVDISACAKKKKESF